ncbi:MAG: hypothetical protein ACKVVP_23340 [Chloroflexota bacterium]
MKPDPYGSDIAKELVHQLPRVSVHVSPERSDIWSALGTVLRASIDYFRYLEPRFRHAPKLKQRAAVWPLEWIYRPLEWKLIRWICLERALRNLFVHIERSIPVPSAIRSYLQVQSPDVLLISPMVDIGSDQVDYVRAAGQLGIPSCLPVASWDNLTNKGLVKVQPDLVTVWNARQHEEAETMHGLDPKRIAITGAPTFDKWFDQRPSCTRDDFLENLGLPKGEACLLYLCSSPFTTPREVSFVLQWLQSIRTASSVALRQAGVLIRPHPQHIEQWENVDMNDSSVVVWPRRRGFSSDRQAHADFVNSILHSNAVIGINTSGQIEAAILNRPVFTILASEFRETQQGTLHFHYIADPESGFAHVAVDLGEHVAQLTEQLFKPSTGTSSNDTFVKSFVRPFGLTGSAAAILANRIEGLASMPICNSTLVSAGVLTVRAVLLPLALVMSMLKYVLRRGQVLVAE